MTDEPMTPEQVFGEVMRQVRLMRGLNQTQLSQQVTRRGVDLTQQQIQKCETGGRPVRLNEAAAIADVLGVPLGVMLKAELPNGPDDVRQALADRTAELERARREEADAELAINHLQLVAQQLAAHLHDAQVAAMFAESGVERLRDEVARVDDAEAVSTGRTRQTARVSPRPPARITTQDSKKPTRKGTR